MQTTFKQIFFLLKNFISSISSEFIFHFFRRRFKYRVSSINSGANSCTCLL